MANTKFDTTSMGATVKEAEFDALTGAGVLGGMVAESIAVSVSIVGPNAAVGMPETTQFVPFCVTVRPAGRPGILHPVRGRTPPVVGIARV